ncbi:MAG: AsmA protein [Gammaproteobacteria bacterium]|jgi:AsmA protein
MKKVIRFLIIGIVAAVALLVVITVIFLSVFDANDYKDDLSTLVKEQTGRDLVFSGDVSLTFFPALGMKLGAMSFANAPGFGSEPMVKINEASISVDIASVIAFNPQVDQLVLRNLEINLIKNKAGVTNWDDLLPAAAPANASTAATSSGSATKSVEDDAASQDTKIQGVFAGLVFENAKLLWLDEQAGGRYEVRDLDIHAGPISPDKPFPFSLHLEASGEEQFDMELDLSANIEYLIESQRLSLENLALSLNGTDIEGRIQVINLSKPSLTFALRSEDMDVDALLSKILTATVPDEVVEVAPTSSTEPAEDIQIALPIELLRDLKIDGKFAFARLKVVNVRMSDVDLTIKADKGVIGIEPLTLKSYNGSVEARVEIDVRKAVPMYRISEKVNGLEVGKLLVDFAEVDAIAGTLNSELVVTTNGEWLSELKKNSNGEMKLSFLDGAIKGFNLRHSIDSAKAKLRKQPAPSKETLKTDFSSLTISGVIKNGVFSSDDLNLQAPLMRVNGVGSADIVNETLNYLVKAKLVRSVDGQESGGADDLDGLLIPVKIQGPFSSPDIDVQLDDMLKARIDAEKARLKAEIDAKKAQLKADLDAEKARLTAELDRQKAELQKQLATEKQALVESKKRELEKQRQVEEARIKAELEKKKEEAKKKLLNKLTN